MPQVPTSPFLPSTQQPSTVSIEGEVRQPGIYPLQRDMRVRELLMMSGGLLFGPEQLRGEVQRLTPDGQLRTLPFDLRGALRGLTFDNLPLQAGDRVILRREGEAEGRRLPQELLEPSLRAFERFQPPIEELSPIERLLAGFLPEPDRPLRQFGYELFRQLPTTFAPVTDIPVGANYLIGTGDELDIVLWGGVQEVHRVEVDRNGAITLPRLGVLQVSGMTLGKLQAFLRQRFGEFYPDFQMAVTLGKLRSMLVYVVGEVQLPGAYTVSSLATMMNALFASGGPTRNGSLRRIQLTRKGKTVQTLDLYDLLLRGDKSQDQALQSGDTIFVPVIGAVAGITGNVKRPAIYEIAPATPLRFLLEAAGGVTPSGYLQRVQVERFVGNARKVVVDLDLSTALPSKTPKEWQMPLQDGDLVSVLPVPTELENAVELEGHVKRPGRYELKPGMRLRDLLTSYDDIEPEPYLDYAEIVRRLGSDRQITVVPFNLSALLAGDPAQNLALQRQDIVRVFAETDYIDPRQVRVSGMVHKPGIYPLTQEMRVSDLVMRAGNVRNFAYMEEAELTRRQFVQAEEINTRVEINLAKALAGDPEQNLPLQNFDHLLVRQMPGVELRREPEFPATLALQQLGFSPADIAAWQRFGVLPADVVAQQRAGTMPADIAAQQRVGTLPADIATQQRLGLLPADIAAQQRTGMATQQRAGALPADIAAQQRRLGILPEERREVPVYPVVSSDEKAAEALRRARNFVEPSVEILGEVRFPGTYPIVRGERLGSLLQRAGGFTDNAYLRGAVFTRQSVQEAQERRLDQLLQSEEESLLSESAVATSTALSAEEVQGQRQALEARRQLLEQLRTVRPEGRVVLRLRPLATFTGSDQDIELEPGDRLVIPQNLKYVNVLGQVYNPVALLYEPGRDLAYYLAQVGGLKSEANEKEIHMVQVDGTVVSNTQDQFIVLQADGRTTYIGDFFAVKPQPGDTIVVPRRVRTPATLRNTRDIVQIIFQSLSTLGVIAALL
jgi:protein involved in polysaccharide export with SLBB domain